MVGSRFDVKQSQMQSQSFQIQFLRQAYLSISKKFNTEENLMPHVNQQLKSDGFTVLQMMVEILHR